MRLRSASVAVLSLLFVLAMHAKAASCHVNTTPESPAQVKNDRFEFKEAATLFDAELKGDLKNAQLRAGQIRNLADAGRVDEADALATRFVQDEPSSGVAATSKAYVLFKQGHLAESYAMNAAAQRLDPCQARVYLYLADYERSIANWQDAWTHI